MSREIRSVLVANRGEIACRVIRGVKEAGLRAATVFSEPDRGALHARLADAAWPLAGSSAIETYLDVEKIIDAAKRLGVDALHPGYGFLSERAAFNEACRRAGIIFIGPPPEAQSIMGVKTSARALAAKAGVPIVPGSAPIESAQEAIDAAKKIGFPLLVKAAAGGGGKGMREVRAIDDLAPAIDGCRRDALASFGDGRVYVERLIERPRHVEVQVLGDERGNVIHLFERECSIQRRHQKVIEETPSVALDAALRKRMGDAAVALARAAGYASAGTVEFLLDPRGEFYFLEMNTRLQVEHPITEETTGIDLVRAQLAIAAGRPLGIAQEDVRPRGHAIEGRVYAEDARRGFLPVAGPVLAWDEPRGPGVRVDAGVVEGGVVPVHYDPVLAKLVVRAATREDAIARFRSALARFCVIGVPTTIPFLELVAGHDAFRAGDTPIDFVDRHLGGLDGVARALAPRAPSEMALIAAAVASARGVGATAMNGAPRSSREPASPWALGDAFRIAPLGGENR